MTTRTPKISRALAGALKARPAEPRSAGVVALAKRLASEIDATDDLDAVAKLSPRLLAALVELGMGRSAAATVSAGGGGSDEPRAVLDELRRARENRAAAVDPAAG